MKKTALILFCLLTTGFSQAQQKAVTETGDEVILYEDKTWKYQNENVLEVTEIPTNPTAFIKDDSSTFLLKSSKLNIGFWLNPKQWSFTKATSNEEAEYELQLRDEDLYGMIITEKVEIPLASLKAIAIENGQSVAPDLEIIKEEYRIVNDLKVLLLQMNGTLQGVKFSYYGYYFSSPQGTIQFITYTSQNLLDSYKSISETLLNGIVQLD
jgi:hypothetical protein